MSVITAESISRETAPAGSFSPDWRSVPISKMVETFNQLAAMLPLPMANAVRATAWMMKVNVFRDVEEIFMTEGKYEESLPDHRVHITELIAEGEEITWHCKKDGLAAQNLKFTLEDLEVVLDSLHVTLRREHGPKNSEKTNERIARLLDGKKS